MRSQQPEVEGSRLRCLLAGLDLRMSTWYVLFRFRNSLARKSGKTSKTFLHVLPPLKKDSHKTVEHDATEFSKFYFRFWTSTSSIQKIVLSKSCLAICVNYNSDLKVILLPYVFHIRVTCRSNFNSFFEMAAFKETFWMEEVIDVRGKQNRGARNFVRQALLDKGLI